MYNKLFGKILDSSIWLEATPTRIVWITLLAAMDEDGFAHFSAIENLAARARVTVEEAREAVECFLAPDPNSGNPANDGRRIDRVPGGFMVLNAAEHRKTITRVIQREQTRVRVARHRENKKLNSEPSFFPMYHQDDGLNDSDNKKAIEQQGSCACCGTPFEKPYSQFVNLDHNHKTGAIRAFICKSCNKVVGQIENGKTCNSINSEKAKTYINRFSSVTGQLPGVTRPPYTEAYTDTDTKAEAITTLASSDKISLSAEGNWVGIPKAFLKKWHEAYPAINIEIELAKAAGWIMANPKNKKSNYARFLTNWLSRSQDRAPPQGPGSAKPSKLERMATAIRKFDGENRG
jgi:hypothetical protein